MKPTRSILALVFLLGLAIPVQANPITKPFVKTGHAIAHAVKAVGHGFVKMLSAIQWPTER